jgi:hypothetical protein
MVHGSSWGWDAFQAVVDPQDLIPGIPYGPEDLVP